VTSFFAGNTFETNTSAARRKYSKQEIGDRVESLFLSKFYQYLRDVGVSTTVNVLTTLVVAVPIQLKKPNKAYYSGFLLSYRLNTS
jgi:hypothetical protein